MSFTLNRSFLIGRRHLIQSTLRCLYSTDNNDPKDSKGDLAQLLLKMKDTQSKPTKHLKAQPSRKIAPQEDSESSSSSSDSSSDDEIILDKETIRITDRVAVEKANEANLDEDGTLALKRSINDDLAKKLKAIKNETKTARRDSEVSGASGGSMEHLLSNMKIQKTKLEKPQRSNIVDEVELTPEQKRFLAERRMLRENRKLKQEAQDHEPIDLLNAEQPLKIFNTEKYSDQFTLDSWKAASIRELQILRTQPPRNLIEDMVTMTEKGILWHFPIDNEQGINANEVMNIKCDIDLSIFHKMSFFRLSLLLITFSLNIIWNLGVLQRDRYASLWKLSALLFPKMRS